jgi:hypothetical protein
VEDWERIITGVIIWSWCATSGTIVAERFEGSQGEDSFGEIGDRRRASELWIEMAALTAALGEV